MEWSYEDVSGNRTELSAMTDASTGVSSLSVTTDVPGYYSCKVSLEGGTNRTYTVEMMDISQYTGISCHLFYMNFTNSITALLAVAFKCNENSYVSIYSRAYLYHCCRYNRRGFYAKMLASQIEFLDV